MEKIPHLRCKKCWQSGLQKVVDNQGVVHRINFTLVSKEYSATQKEEYYKCTHCGSDKVEQIGVRLHANLKETCWRTVYFEFPVSMTEEEIVKKIKDTGPESVWEHEVDSDSDHYEEMTVEQNLGYSTVEICRDDGDIVWENGKDTGVSADRAASKSLENVEIL